MYSVQPSVRGSTEVLAALSKVRDTPSKFTEMVWAKEPSQQVRCIAQKLRVYWLPISMPVMVWEKLPMFCRNADCDDPSGPAGLPNADGVRVRPEPPRNVQDWPHPVGL